MLSVGESLLSEIDGYGEERWHRHDETIAGPRSTLGALAQYSMTVPGQPAFVHASIHLGHLDWLQPARAS